MLLYEVLLLTNPAQEKEWLGKLTTLNMTLMGWLGCKTSTQTNYWETTTDVFMEKHSSS